MPCTSCELSDELVLTGAGARVIWMSPLTVFARISTSGPSPTGASGVSVELGARVAADGVAVEKDLRAAADADLHVAGDGVGRRPGRAARRASCWSPLTVFALTSP